MNREGNNKPLGRYALGMFCLPLFVSIVGPVFASGDRKLSPDHVVLQLKQGNRRFQENRAQRPNADPARIHATAQNGQHPAAIVLSCADSRVCPELLFDQGIGDLFTIRVAGNVCNDDEIGSIDYAVEHLKVPVCIVLGHTGCGAVTAAASGAKLDRAMEHLVAHIRQAVRTVHAAHPKLKGQALVAEVVRENVWESITDLFKGSPIVREQVRGGKLIVIGAIYDLKDGNIHWLGSHPKQNALISSH